MGCGFSSPVLDDDTVIFAVMGVTGSGKSTLVHTVTQKPSVAIGHGLESVTTQVRPYYFTHRNVRYCLVDTPGFDDTSIDYMDITAKILNWLAQNFKDGTRLNGIIYLHSLRNPRMTFSSNASLRLFRNLCGDEFENVVLGTTFWDIVGEEVGCQRESEMRRSFWGPLLRRGANIARITRDRDVCLELIEDMAARNGKMILKVQKDIVLDGRDMCQTSAWRQALKDSQGLQARQRVDKEYNTKMAQSVQRHQKDTARHDRRFGRKKKQKKSELARAKRSMPGESAFSTMEWEERDKIDSQRGAHIAQLNSLYNH